MGKKKKKGGRILKPFCWYCERLFDNERVLVEHQKAKHFKCRVCGKRMITASGLVTHLRNVHKERLTAVPESVPGKESVEWEIYGMEGVPEEEKKAFYKKIYGTTGSDDESDEEDVEELKRKIAEADAALAAVSQPPAKRINIGPTPPLATSTPTLATPTTTVPVVQQPISQPQSLPYIPPQTGPIAFSLKPATVGTTATTSSSPAAAASTTAKPLLSFNLSFNKPATVPAPAEPQEPPVPPPPPPPLSKPPVPPPPPPPAGAAGEVPPPPPPEPFVESIPPPPPPSSVPPQKTGSSSSDVYDPLADDDDD